MKKTKPRTTTIRPLLHIGASEAAVKAARDAILALASVPEDAASEGDE